MPRVPGVFPIFEDGDVEIRLSRRPEDRFMLHSVVLSLHSFYLKASLSERWSNLGDERATRGANGWKYQLLFSDNDDPGVPLLVKANSEVLPYASVSSISEDTSSIFLDDVPFVPQDDSKTSGRMEIIAAYRKFFQLMFHEPLDFASYDFAEAIIILKAIMDIADVYGSLALLKMPVDLYFRTVPAHMATSSRPYYLEMLQLAMATESAFLFREAGCRLIGDPSCSNEDMKAKLTDLHPAVLPLLLAKRAKLETMMNGIGMDIFMIQSWPSMQRRPRDIFVIAMYREELAKHFYAHRKDKWSAYPVKFRELRDHLTFSTSRNGTTRWNAWCDRIARSFQNIGGKATHADMEPVFQSLAARAITMIDPLFQCVVEKSTAKMSKREASHQGFLCIDITEEELPWSAES